MDKLAATMVSDAYEAQVQRKDIKIDDTPTKNGRSKSQASDAEDTSSNPNPPPTMTPRQSTIRSIPSGYIMVSQLFLTEIMMRLSNMETNM